MIRVIDLLPAADISHCADHYVGLVALESERTSSCYLFGGHYPDGYRRHFAQV
jgi:hypothetical protein